MRELLKHLWRDERGEGVVGGEGGGGGGFTGVEPGEAVAAPTETGGPTLEEALQSPALTLLGADDPGEAGGGDPSADPHHSEAQPRVPAGEPEGGEFAGEPPAGEGEAPPVGEEAPAGDEGDPVAESGEDPSTDFSLTAPAAEEGGDPVDLVFGEIDDGTREALTRLQGRADEVVGLQASLDRLEQQRSDIESDVEEVASNRFELEHDPIGYVTERIDPSHRLNVALALLQDEEIYRGVTTEMERWEGDPGARRVAAAESRAERAEHRADIREAIANRREVRDQTRAILGAINGLVPSGMAQERAELFRDDSMRDVVAHINQQPEGFVLAGNAVAGVLARRLEIYGITAEETSSGAATRTMWRFHEQRPP